ncbi:MAG TPA: DUF535 family protein [Opitutaceae bacterium]|jgi:uncharacterized protein VirK/YbjX|nr:DUF535 family protein [Opitutaceae bacterium]
MLPVTPCLTADADWLETQTPPSSLTHPPTLSFWAASSRAKSGSSPRELRKRAKFFLRALSQPRLTRAWLARLVQPDLAPLWALRPRLALKLQRPYLCCAWGTLERFAALVGHYDALPGLFSAGACAAIFRDGLSIARLVNSSSGQRLDVQLFYHDKFEKEGELTLAIREVGTGLLLAGLTFALVCNAGRRIVIIGGLQAGHDPRICGLIHETAQGLHGLRPKALALWCLQQLTLPWQITQIQAVGDAQHVWRHWRKRLEIAASYDEFWRESDGRELPGGGSWELPLQPRPRSRQELKPSRRKQHERRYALLDELRPKLLAAFSALAPGNNARAALAAGPVEFIYMNREPATAPALARAMVETQVTLLAASTALNHSF